MVSSAIGALIYGFIPEELILRYAGGTSLWAMPGAALIGVPFYVNGSAVVPIVYSLSLKGLTHALRIHLTSTQFAV